MPYSDGVRYTSDDIAVTILRVNMTLYCHGNLDIIHIMVIKGGCPDNVTFQLYYVRTFFLSVDTHWERVYYIYFVFNQLHGVECFLRS
jgi:hypothetical protein